MSKPSTRIRPAVGSSSPEMQPMVVDLPAPFGPSTPKIAPASAANDTPSTATRSPYSFLRPLTSITWTSR